MLTVWFRKFVKRYLQGGYIYHDEGFWLCPCGRFSAQYKIDRVYHVTERCDVFRKLIQESPV